MPKSAPFLLSCPFLRQFIEIRVVKVCAVAAQPGHTKELQSIQLERGLRIVDSPGVIFDDDEGIQGQKESSVLLRNVVKAEDVDDPISVGALPPPFI